MDPPLLLDPGDRPLGRPGDGSNDDATPSRGARNGERYPLYQRVDLSVARRFERGRARFEPFVSVVNLLNRQNVFLYAFDQGAEPPRIRSLSQLPLFPSVGLRVEF